MSTLRSFDSDSQQKAAELASKLSAVLAFHNNRMHLKSRSPMPYSPNQLQQQQRTATKSPNLQPSVSSSRGPGLSPGQNSWPIGQHQEFAFNNLSTYEDLFDAVELAGVRSSDAVEDLFSQTSLEHYSTFDDHWPSITTPENDNIDSHIWSNQSFSGYTG